MNTRLKRGIELYVSSAIVYGFGILIFYYLPYYQNFLIYKTKLTMLYLYIGYLVIAPFFYFFSVNEYSRNKPYTAVKAAGKFIIRLMRGEGFVISPDEKNALLFILVKLFFLPTMTNFFYGNFSGLLSNWKSIVWYPFLLVLLFTIDTFVFALGYAFESKKMGNLVKSVEPTFSGWFVAVICYPPFNSFVGAHVPWGANDNVFFWSNEWTLAFRIILIGLLVVYVWATVALGLRSSNLTNRGIVSKFPYSMVRHPAYICKNLFWWITLLPVMNMRFFLGMLFWIMIYFFRAVTEERHLRLDADYVAYCEKVKYRFIPGVI